MSGEFGTRPEELDAASRRYDDAADEVAQTLARLRSTLDGLGDYLGGDEQGRAFAGRYDPQAADGLTAIGREADSLRTMGVAMRQAAQAFRDGDDDGAARFRRPGPG